MCIMKIDANKEMIMKEGDREKNIDEGCQEQNVNEHVNEKKYSIDEGGECG